MALAHGRTKQVIHFKLDPEKLGSLLGLDVNVLPDEAKIRDAEFQLSFAEFLQVVQSIKQKVAWLMPADAKAKQDEFPLRVREQLQSMDDLEKEQHRIYYEVYLLALMKAFHYSMIGRTYQQEAKDQKDAKDAAIAADAQLTSWQRFKSKLKFYAFATGAVVSEGSDGFLGGTTLLSKIIGGVPLLVAGVASALIHSVVHYMVTINAMKRQLNIKDEEHIIPLAKLHTEQIEMSEKINESLTISSRIRATFGNTQEQEGLRSYVAHAKIGIEFNQYLAKKNKAVREYVEPKSVWGWRWFIGISEAIINGSFSFLAIKLTFLFILGGMAITPAGWALLVVMLVVITLASLATITNMLGDMNLGVRAALNPGLRQTNALFRKAKTYMKNDEFMPDVEKNIQSEVDTAVANFAKDLDHYFARQAVVPAEDIARLQSQYEDLQQKVRLSNLKLDSNGELGGDDGETKRTTSLPMAQIMAPKGANTNKGKLRELGLRYEYLIKKNEFLIQADKMIVLERKIDAFFELESRFLQTNEAVTENGKNIKSFEQQLAELKECALPLSDSTLFSPQETLVRLSAKLLELQNKQKALTEKYQAFTDAKDEQRRVIESLTTQNRGLSQQIEHLTRTNENLTKFTTAPDLKSSRSPHASPVKPKIQRASSDLNRAPPQCSSKLFSHSPSPSPVTVDDSDRPLDRLSKTPPLSPDVSPVQPVRVVVIH